MPGRGRGQRAVDRRDAARACSTSAPPTSTLRLFVLPAFAAAYPDLVAALPTEVAPIDGRSRLRAHRRRVHLARRAAPTRPRPRAPRRRHGARPRGRRPACSPSTTSSPSRRRPPTRGGKRALPRPGRAAAGARQLGGSPCRASSCGARCSTALDADPGRRSWSIPHARARSARRPPRATSSSSATASPGPVVLYPAITYPHKDHATLARGLRARARRHHPDAVLVLPGRSGAERGGGRGPDRRRARGCRQQVRRLGPHLRRRRRRAARAGRRRGGAVALRGLRPARPRGDGRRRRGRGRRRHVAPGGRRRRRASRRRRGRRRRWAAAIGGLLDDADGAGPPGRGRPGAGGRASPPRPTPSGFADALPTGRWPAA